MEIALAETHIPPLMMGNKYKNASCMVTDNTLLTYSKISIEPDQNHGRNSETINSNAPIIPKYFLKKSCTLKFILLLNHLKDLETFKFFPVINKSTALKNY